MLKLELSGARRLLYLGSHPDDIEIGCGGTLFTLAEADPGLNVLWVVFSGNMQRAEEARKSGQRLLEKVGQRKVVMKQFRESFFPSQSSRIKTYFETLKKFRPDLIFTHYRDDRHQDHRLVSDLTWNTFRNHFILEYEVPKYDGDLGQPNLFVPLEPPVAHAKARHICGDFPSQKAKHWFSEDTFLGLMRLRGVECGAAFAEAFYCRKIVCA